MKSFSGMLALVEAGKIRLAPDGICHRPPGLGTRPINGREAVEFELDPKSPLDAAHFAGRFPSFFERKPLGHRPGATHNKQEEHMRKTWLFTAALILGAASFAFAAPPQGNAKEGEAVYAQHCKMCHGAHGEGNQAIAKMMKVKMLPLGSKEVQAKSNAELKKDITHGVGKMSPIKNLSDKQLDDVIAFIRELGKGKK